MDTVLVVKPVNSGVSVRGVEVVRGAKERISTARLEKFEVIDPATGRAPESLKVQRRGNDLVLRVEEKAATSVGGNAKAAEVVTEAVLEGYYPNEAQLLGVGNEGGALLEYRALDGLPALDSLGEGGVTTLNLAGSYGDVLLASLGGWAGVGVGALAVGGVAVAVGNGGGKSSTEAANAQAAALAKISAAAEADSATASSPALTDYTAAGVTGVTAANLGAINSALDTAAVNGVAVDTTAEVQALVDAYNAVLTAADGTADGDAGATQAQYGLLGVTGLDTPATSLLNSVVDKSPTTAVDTVPELQALADAAKAVSTGAAGGSAPTQAQLAALGITGVTADNLAAIQQAIAGTADDGSAVDTLAELQAVVTAAAAPPAPSLALATDSGSSTSDGITNVGTVNVSGLESGATWQYQVDGGAWTAGTGSAFTLTAGSHTYAVRQTDTAGNLSTASTSYTYDFDQTPPTSSLTTATLNTGSNATVQSSELGTAYLVNTTVTVTSLADIIGAADANWNSVSITTANTDTNLAMSGLNSGTYKLYTADAAGNLSGASAGTVTTSVAGQAVIDLGAYGKLINGVQVEGNWYYYWDRSGDGTTANAGPLNGGRDETTHDVLDAIFKYDVNGNLNPGSNTDNTYRYATLGGVKVALPTHGGTVGGSGLATDVGTNKSGTAISSGASNNPTYNDLLAIWDAYNGAGTGTGIAGVPSGWNNGYWSATATASGHAYVNFYGGYVSDYEDTDNNYVALQVL